METKSALISNVSLTVENRNDKIKKGGAAVLSEERIRKMIRLSDFETGQGGIDLRRTHYQKADYVRLQVLKTAVSVFVSCLLIALIILLYRLEYWMQYLFELPYRYIGVGGLLFFVLSEGIAIVATVRIAAREYEESKLRVKEYDATLRELLDLYEEEEGQEESAL